MTRSGPVSSEPGGLQGELDRLDPAVHGTVGIYHAFDFQPRGRRPGEPDGPRRRGSTACFARARGSAGANLVRTVAPTGECRSSRAATSYAGCQNDVEAPIDEDNHGVLYLNSRVSYDDISDGPAFTILAGEFTGGGPSLGWAVGTMSSLRNTGQPINFDDPIAGIDGPRQAYRSAGRPTCQSSVRWSRMACFLPATWAVSRAVIREGPTSSSATARCGS